MNEHPILAHVTLGYSPVVDRQRAVVGTRLTVFPERPDAAPDAAALLAALAEVWPTPTEAPELKLRLRPLDPASVKSRAASQALQPVSLNIAGEPLLRAVMASRPSAQWMIEVPAFMAAEAATGELIDDLGEAGSTVLLKGRPSVELPAALLQRFGHAIVEPGAEAPRGLSALHAGVRTLAALDAAFAKGAVATFGWPIDDPVVPTARRSVPQDVQVVLELINGVDREDPAPKLEATLKKDPTLAFRLLRYLNSPAFGLSVEINSFGHALMMLGYQRLKRWLALLLASSSKDAVARPVMFAAVRRGLLMEELVRENGDAELRGEMFICGVFSLLDRLLRQPFGELFQSVPVPERVRQALVDEAGPFQPHLDLVRAIEQESLFDIRECSEKLLMGPQEVNRALLAALAAARALD